MQLGYRDRKAGFITLLAAYLSNDNFLMGNCNMLTQEKLKKILDYNYETGVFVRRGLIRGVRTGKEAGTITPCGYRSILVDGSHYLAHRLAWMYVNGSWPKEYTDHINHIRSDNRIINLREVNKFENQKNQSLSAANKSGITGVYWNKAAGKWRSQIRVCGKQLYLGRFADKFEAVCARLSVNNKYGYHKNHGDKK